ncbi:alpha/beta hydrolase [Mucilaginibacter robiniae]|uniref:Alpha/beta hydrolase n=1 Tax=Mucilaginibacter robiniae TaxID=2728022 RepID=A0A7L5E8R7_9SPHI|nr:alpha/beta hydrolase [Mucilaginibacter robiniae]
MQHASTKLLNISFLEQGRDDSQVVLLLHGWPDNATTWNNVIPPLMAAGYRVIAPWLRGFGSTTFHEKSTPRTGNSGIHAFDMIELMDSLDIKKFSIVGHDWGSNIAEAMAVGWPDRVECIALLSTPPRLGGMPTPPFQHAQLEWYHWFQATKRGADAVRQDPRGFAHIMWENWSPKGWFSEDTFAQVAQSWQNPDFVDITLHSYRSRWDEAEPDPKSEKLEKEVKATKTLSLPALFVQGEVDGVNPPYVSENVHEKFTGPFERVLMPGVGHFPSREAPDLLSQHLLNFLQQSLATSSEE